MSSTIMNMMLGLSAALRGALKTANAARTERRGFRFMIGETVLVRQFNGKSSQICHGFLIHSPQRHMLDIQAPILHDRGHEKVPLIALILGLIVGSGGGWAIAQYFTNQPGAKANTYMVARKHNLLLVASSISMIGRSKDDDFPEKWTEAPFLANPTILFLDTDDGHGYVPEDEATAVLMMDAASAYKISKVNDNRLVIHERIGLWNDGRLPWCIFDRSPSGIWSMSDPQSGSIEQFVDLFKNPPLPASENEIPKDRIPPKEVRYCSDILRPRVQIIPIESSEDAVQHALHNGDSSISSPTIDDFIGHWSLIQFGSEIGNHNLCVREMILSPDGTVDFFDIYGNDEKLRTRTWRSEFKFDPEKPKEIFFVNRTFSLTMAKIGPFSFARLEATNKDPEENFVQVFKIEKFAN